MNKIGIFYGSTTGYTADIANRIAKELGVGMADIRDVANTDPSALGDYDVLVLGSSTWGAGELQSDWEDFINGAEELYLKDKKIAIFGCGDESHSDTFNGALGTIYQRMQKTEADFIAPFNADGFDFDESPAKIDGQYVGLMLDEVNHPDLSDNKIKEWANIIKQSI